MLLMGYKISFGINTIIVVGVWLKEIKKAWFQVA